MFNKVANISSTFQIKSALTCAFAAAMLIQAAPASAASISDKVAKGARTCVTSGVCGVTATGRALGGAVRSMDRLGWEIGRTVSIKKLGRSGDPGRYPGMKR